MLTTVQNPDATTAELSVVRAFLRDAGIDWKGVRTARDEMLSLKEALDSREDLIVPFIDPLTRRKY
jgi:hypothetical protein